MATYKWKIDRHPNKELGWIIYEWKNAKLTSWHSGNFSSEELAQTRLNKRKWLFSNKWGRKLNRNNLTNYFFILRKKTISAYPELENELNNIQFRDLRAKAATDIYLSQSIENAQKHLGHTDSKMTKRYIRKDKLLKPIDVISE